MKSIYVHLRPDQFEFSNQLKHSGYVYTDLPAYANISIKQTEQFLNTPAILIDNDIVNDEFKTEINEFFKLCKSGFPSFYSDPFWLLTLLRLYVVFLYCKKHNIDNFVHLEYDNLIYTDLKCIEKLQPSIYFTKLGPYSGAAGFVYCNSLSHFENFIQCIEQLLKKGENFVRRFTQYDFLSEMIMIDLISTHKQGVIDYLPILPNGVGSDNFDMLGSLFDCASYGQFLGGTNNGNEKGWYGLHQYIGQRIHNKSINIVFDKKQTPYVVLPNNDRLVINNLHIHSKKLENFICEK
jgi:hypothetical protein